MLQTYLAISKENVSKDKLNFFSYNCTPFVIFGDRRKLVSRKVEEPQEVTSDSGPQRPG